MPTSGVDQNADFGPEVLTPMFSAPSDERWTNTASCQSLFGITARPKLLPSRGTMRWWRWRRSLLAKLDYNATNGTKPTYELMLVMASGIQGAGPSSRRRRSRRRS